MNHPSACFAGAKLPPPGWRRSGILLWAATLLAAGCARTPPATDQVSPPAASRPPAQKSKVFRLVGQVREVKPASRQVILHHEEIPGFMKAMTMPFSIKDAAVFDDLHPGDEVEGKLRVEFEGENVRDYELTDLVVTRPALAAAPPPALELNIATGAARDTIRPKRLEPGEPVPDFRMTMQEGRTVALSDLRGQVVVLTFIYTRCPLPDFCPLMDRKFAGLADAIAARPARAEQVRLISLSFDPEHDTPTVLTQHAKTQGAHAPLWTFAVASHDELAKVAPALGLTYGPTATEIIHNLSTAVIDRDGKLAALFVGSSSKTWTPAEMLKIITPLLPRDAGSR